MHNRPVEHKKRLNKVIAVDASYVFEDTVSACCVELTQAQIRLLLSILEPQKWPNRWYGSVPPVDTLEAFISDLERRLLMTPCEGEPGEPGAPGADGREIELQEYFGTVQWRYVGDPVWMHLFTLPSDGADGADGREIELQEYFGTVQWRYVGDPVWMHLFTLPPPGADGREIELQEYFGTVQWRYVGDPVWQTLFIIPTGEPGADGADGRTAEFRVSGGWFQWRYTDEVSWTNLYQVPDEPETTVCYEQCDYAYNAADYIRRRISYLFNRIFMVTGGGWGLTKRGIQLNDSYNRHLAHPVWISLFNYEDYVGRLYDIRHQVSTPDNVLPTGGEFTPLDIETMLDMVIIQVADVLCAGIDDCGGTSAEGLIAVRDALDTLRKATGLPDIERWAYQMYWLFIYNIDTAILQDIYRSHVRSVDPAIKAQMACCADPVDPPLEGCEEFDWSIVLDLDGSEPVEIINGIQNASSVGSETLTYAPCPEGQERADIMVHFSAPADLRRIEITYDVSHPTGTPPSVNVALTSYTGAVLTSVNSYTTTGATLEHIFGSPGTSSGAGASLQRCRTQESQPASVFAITQMVLCGNGEPPTITAP